MALVLSKKVQSLLFCGECRKPVEPTPSLYLACPSGHGKLCSLEEIVNRIKAAEGNGLPDAVRTLENFMCQLFDMQAIEKDQLARVQRRLKRNFYGT